MKVYTKKDIAAANRGLDKIMKRIEYLANCPENKDGELKASTDPLYALREKAESLVTYLYDIHPMY